MKKYKTCPHCGKPIEKKPIVIKGIDGEVFMYLLMVIGIFLTWYTLVWFGMDGIRRWFGL